VIIRRLITAFWLVAVTAELQLDEQNALCIYSFNYKQGDDKKF
jgi:hypothetical protein